MPFTVGAHALDARRRGVVAELQLVQHRDGEDALQRHDARSAGLASM